MFSFADAPGPLVLYPRGSAVPDAALADLGKNPKGFLYLGGGALGSALAGGMREPLVLRQGAVGRQAVGQACLLVEHMLPKLD